MGLTDERLLGIEAEWSVFDPTNDPLVSDVLDLVAEVRLLQAALKELLKAGAHDGPCEGDGYDSCEHHVAAAQTRRDRAIEALRAG